MRHVHRHLPGGRAHLGQLPLQDPPLGDEARGHRLHPLRRRLQDHAGRAALPARRRDRARRQPRQERHQRRLSVREGALRLRLRCPRGAVTAAFDPQGQPPRPRHLGGGAGAGGRKVQGDPGARGRRRPGRDRVHPHLERGKLPAAEVRAPGARNQQCGPPPHRRLSRIHERAGGQEGRHRQPARRRQRARHPADRQRSHLPASAAGLADPYQRAPAPRPPLCRQFFPHQAAAAGRGLRAHPRGQRTQAGRLPQRRRGSGRVAGAGGHHA